MSPNEVSSISPSFTQQPTQKSPSPQTEKGTIPSAANTSIIIEKQTNAVDTVSILHRLQPVKSDPVFEAAKKDAAHRSVIDDKTAIAIGDVQFAYNFKGDLRIRFMDRANRLIYQVPPEILARVAESMAQNNSTVDTQA